MPIIYRNLCNIIDARPQYSYKKRNRCPNCNERTKNDGDKTRMEFECKTWIKADLIYQCLIDVFSFQRTRCRLTQAFSACAKQNGFSDKSTNRKPTLYSVKIISFGSPIFITVNPFPKSIIKSTNHI